MKNTYLLIYALLMCGVEQAGASEFITCNFHTYFKKEDRVENHDAKIKIEKIPMPDTFGDVAAGRTPQSYSYKAEQSFALSDGVSVTVGIIFADNTPESARTINYSVERGDGFTVKGDALGRLYQSILSPATAVTMTCRLAN